MASGIMFTLFNQQFFTFLKSVNSLLFVCCLSLLCNKAFAYEVIEASEWKIWQASQHRSVSYRSIQHSGLIEIKARMQLVSSLAGFLLFIQDTAKIPLWLDNSSQAQVIKNINPTTLIFQTDFNAIWPIKNRVMIIKSHYWQNDDLSVEIAIEDFSGIEDMGKDKKTEIKNNRKSENISADNISIKVISAHWVITPLIHNEILIEYQFIADAQGSVPTWLANRLTLQSIWKTLNNIKQQLPSSYWQKESLPQIKEMK
jgi:hypothetical protein